MKIILSPWAIEDLGNLVKYADNRNIAKDGQLLDELIYAIRREKWENIPTHNS